MHCYFYSENISLKDTSWPVLEYGTIPIKDKWGITEYKGSSKTINAGEGWIDNREKINNFYLSCYYFFYLWVSG